MLDEAFGLEPELVHVGADPTLTVPTKFIVGPIGTSLELVEKQMVEDRVIHDRRFSILRVGWRPNAWSLSVNDRAADRQNSHDEESDCDRPHDTITARNMPASMW